MTFRVYAAGVLLMISIYVSRRSVLFSGKGYSLQLIIFNDLCDALRLDIFHSNESDIAAAAAAAAASAADATTQ